MARPQAKLRTNPCLLDPLDSSGPALPDARERSPAESVQGSGLPEHDRNENQQGAKNLPGIEPLVEYDPAQQGGGCRVEQRQKGDRTCRQSLQTPNQTA